MSWILTARGRHFDYLDPRDEDIDILDIAQGLANECRFGGHTRAFYSVAQHAWLTSQIVPAFYSVAQHAWLTSQIVPAEHALEALLHDASEAYCKDIPQPLKQLLPDYRDIEARVEGAIRATFGLPLTMSPAVKQADLILLATERRDLMPADDTPWAILDGIEPMPRKLISMHPAKAQSVFLKRYVELTEHRRAA